MVAGVLECRADREPDLTTSDSESLVGTYGGDSGTLLAYVEAHVEKLNGYDYLLLNSGLHDIRFDPRDGSHLVEINRFEANLGRLLETVSGFGTKPIWVTTTPVDDARHQSLVTGFERHDADVVAYNEVAMRTAHEMGAPVIDLYRFTKNLATQLYADNVHFTEEVQALQAAFIAGALFALCR